MDLTGKEKDSSVSSEIEQTSEDMVNGWSAISTATLTASTTVITTTRSSNFLYIVEPLSNITINAGKEARLRCHVRGSPQPKFRWYKNEAPFEGEKRGRITIRKDHEGSRIRIRNLDVPDTGYYRCEATNGIERVETTGILKVLMVPGRPPPPLDLEDMDHEYEEPAHVAADNDIEDSLNTAVGIRAPDVSVPGSCQAYKGTACAKFLKNVTVYIGSYQTQNHIEESLMAAFASIPRHTELSTQCTEYAVPSLCYHMFPVCDEGSIKKRPRELCRDECDVLESEICRKEYAIANGHPLLKQFMPDCRRLPVEQSIEHRKCIRLGLRPSKQSRTTNEDCFTENGTTYSGKIKQTVSGGECKKWDSVNYPDFAHHNYCRNPGGVQSRPWCHNNKDEAVELCSLPKCARPVDDTYVNFLYILAACGALLTLIIIASILFCICRRMRRRERKDTFKANIKANPLELNALIPKYQIHNQIPEVDMGNLRFLDIMGEGIFGKVYAGDLTTEGCTKAAVIRMLRETGNVKAKQDFHKDLKQWSEFRHPNLATLLAAHTSRDPLVLVFEHTTYGDLHEYLETLSDRSTKSMKSMEVGNTSENLRMTTQVAAGLEFLSANCYVHRDVATRNCWIFEGGVVKVADHGVGASRYPEDYSRIHNHTLPIRWMAPESINYNQATLHSSVWSFGVLMWEIWSGGRQPYYGCSLPEILQMIRTRQLLSQPEDCPSNIYALMVECWHENSVRRPSFKELHQRLWNWENNRIGGNTGGELNNSGRSRSTVSQHSSNGPGSHSNNTGSTHVSNVFPIASVPQFNFNGMPTSPNFNTKLETNDARRQITQAHCQSGTNSIIPPSPLLRNSAMNTPQFRGPRFGVIPQPPPLNTLNFDSFRTTNL